MGKKVKVCLFILTIFCLFLPSCRSIKGMEKYYLSEPKMSLQDTDATLFENNAAIYREGASGANGNKAGGGCGCH